MFILEGFPRGSPIVLTGLVKSGLLYVLCWQMGVQSGAYEYQDGCGQEDDRIVGAETEGARAAGKQSRSTKQSSTFNPKFKNCACSCRSGIVCL
jgi:hypothetical protein